MKFFEKLKWFFIGLYSPFSKRAIINEATFPTNPLSVSPDTIINVLKDSVFNYRCFRLAIEIDNQKHLVILTPTIKNSIIRDSYMQFDSTFIKCLPIEVELRVGDELLFTAKYTFYNAMVEMHRFYSAILMGQFGFHNDRGDFQIKNFSHCRIDNFSLKSGTTIEDVEHIFMMFILLHES